MMSAENGKIDYLLKRSTINYSDLLLHPVHRYNAEMEVVSKLRIFFDENEKIPKPVLDSIRTLLRYDKTFLSRSVYIRGPFYKKHRYLSVEDVININNPEFLESLVRN